MEQDEFWNIVDNARDLAQGSCEQQSLMLEDRLSLYTSKEIVSFFYIYRDYLDKLFLHSLREAYYIMTGSGSEDGFTDFRSWIISRGKIVVEDVLNLTDSLATIEVDRNHLLECEAFGHSALYAYEKVTGEEMPILYDSSVIENIPVIDMDNLFSKHPLLWAKYNSPTSS